MFQYVSTLLQYDWSIQTNDVFLFPDGTPFSEEVGDLADNWVLNWYWCLFRAENIQD